METKITDSQMVTEDGQGNLLFRNASLLKVLKMMKSAPSNSQKPNAHPTPRILPGV